MKGIQNSVFHAGELDLTRRVRGVLPAKFTRTCDVRIGAAILSDYRRFPQLITPHRTQVRAYICVNMSPLFIAEKGEVHVGQADGSVNAHAQEHQRLRRTAGK